MGYLVCLCEELAVINSYMVRMQPQGSLSGETLPMPGFFGKGQITSDRHLTQFLYTFSSFPSDAVKNTLELPALSIVRTIRWRMLLTPDDINKLAQLARINIDSEMVGEVAASITTILTLVDQLQAVDTHGVAPMSHPMDAVQRLRADIVTESNQRDALQAIAPATEDGLYLVPKVLD